MQDLIVEYKQSLKMTRAAIRNACDEDKTFLGRMESDLLYAIEWMTTARRPGSRRGIERRSAYQREQAIDPIILDSHVDNGESTCSVSEQDKERIEEALNGLSAREKEVYIMVRGSGLSRNEVAELLGVQKGTVNKMLTRCDEKLKIMKSSKLFYEKVAN